jgi:hypothetical protein
MAAQKITDLNQLGTRPTLPKNTPEVTDCRNFRLLSAFHAGALRLGNTPIAVAGTLRYLGARGHS